MPRRAAEAELPPCYAMVFPGLEEVAGDEITRDVLVDDQPSRSSPAVEAPVGEREEPKLAERDRASGPPRDAGHPPRLCRVDSSDRSSEVGDAL